LLKVALYTIKPTIHIVENNKQKNDTLRFCISTINGHLLSRRGKTEKPPCFLFIVMSILCSTGQFNVELGWCATTSRKPKHC
jgi:hypothetical protein